MAVASASIRSDGSCVLVDLIDGHERIWDSVAALAADWIADQREGRIGDAYEFFDAVCGDAGHGVVEALIALSEAADGDEDLLGQVGAGPLEDLVSHSGNGSRVLAEVDRAARQSPSFRAALRSVWLGEGIPQPVKARLVELGAQDITRG